MATETLRPTVVVKPGEGLSGDPCNPTTATSATCDPKGLCSTGSLKRESADHKTWQSASYQAYYTSLTLKVPWILDPIDPSNNNCSQQRMYLQYSTNGGAAWANFDGFPKNATGSTQSGTAIKTLSVGQNLANLRVRIKVEATSSPCPAPTGACCVSGFCTTTTQAACAGEWTEGLSCSPNPCGGGGGGGGGG